MLDISALKSQHVNHPFLTHHPSNHLWVASGATLVLDLLTLHHFFHNPLTRSLHQNFYPSLSSPYLSLHILSFVLTSFCQLDILLHKPSGPPGLGQLKGTQPRLAHWQGSTRALLGSTPQDQQVGTRRPPPKFFTGTRQNWFWRPNKTRRPIKPTNTHCIHPRLPCRGLRF